MCYETRTYHVLRTQLAADLVSGEEIEYTGLDRAFLAHCRPQWLRVCFGISGLKPKSTRNRRALLAEKRDSSNYFNNLQFVDGH